MYTLRGLGGAASIRAGSGLHTQSALVSKGPDSCMYAGARGVELWISELPSGMPNDGGAIVCTEGVALIPTLQNGDAFSCRGGVLVD